MFVHSLKSSRCEKWIFNVLDNVGSYVWGMSASLAKAAYQSAVVILVFETAWILFVSLMKNNVLRDYTEHMDIDLFFFQFYPYL